MNVLMGIVHPDSGNIVLNGVKTVIPSPGFAVRSSIGMVPQELNVVPEITIAENIFMGIPNLKCGLLLDWKATNNEAIKLMQGLGCKIDVRGKAKECTVAQLQMVQIARALAFGARILIFDEPTASLTYQETRELFRIMRQLKNSGAAIIFISHHLEEVMEISDRVSVMRDGEMVYTCDAKDITISRVISLMAGQDIVFSRLNRNFLGTDVALKVESLTARNHLKTFLLH
jgi:ABC-type sugar transport system ATPase subunit